MTEMHQLLCGKINLWDEVDGRTVLRPHPLQVAEGVCAHEGAHPAWQAAMDGAARRGWRYLGLQGDAEWPVHVWLDGESIHGVTVPPSPRRPAWEAGAKPVKGAKYTRDVWAPSGAPVPPVTYDRTWPEAEALPPHPAPERTSREMEPDGVAYPSALEKLDRRAGEQGWRVRRQSARGHGVHGSTGRPTALKDSYALRFWRPGLGAYAVHDGGTWTSCWTWSAEQSPLQVSVTELEAWLVAQGKPAPEWYEQRRARLNTATKIKCPGAPGCTEQARHEHRGDGSVRLVKARASAGGKRAEQGG